MLRCALEAGAALLSRVGGEKVSAGLFLSPLITDKGEEDQKEAPTELFSHSPLSPEKPGMKGQELVQLQSSAVAQAKPRWL